MGASTNACTSAGSGTPMSRFAGRRRNNGDGLDSIFRGLLGERTPGEQARNQTDRKADDDRE